MSKDPKLLNEIMNGYLKAEKHESLLNEIKKKVNEDGYNDELLLDIDTVKIHLKRKVSDMINDSKSGFDLNETDTRSGQSETMKTTFLEEYFFIIFKALVFVAIFVFIYFYWFNKKKTPTLVND
jgi:hypothetical protein